MGKKKIYDPNHKSTIYNITRSVGDFVAKNIGIIDIPEIKTHTIKNTSKYLVILNNFVIYNFSLEKLENYSEKYLQNSNIKDLNENIYKTFIKMITFNFQRKSTSLRQQDDIVSGAIDGEPEFFMLIIA